MYQLWHESLRVIHDIVQPLLPNKPDMMVNYKTEEFRAFFMRQPFIHGLELVLGLAGLRENKSEPNVSVFDRPLNYLIYLISFFILEKTSTLEFASSTKSCHIGE